MEQMHFLMEAQSGSKSDSNVKIKAGQILISKMEMDGNIKQASPQFLQRIQTDRNSVDHNEEIALENIHRLKDVQLESQLKTLVGRERQLLHLILKHIQEVDRRKLFAARAFSTLFEYLTKEMGYSSGAAQRRIEAARLMNQVPELALKIQKGDVNLSQIGIITQAMKLKESQLGKKLSAEVKREVIAEVAQKTTAQTQVLVAEKLDLPLQQPERKIMQKDQSCVISITLTPAQQMKLQRCRELLAAKLQQGNKAFTTVNYLEELMDFYLNKKDPCHKNTQKDKDESKTEKSKDSSAQEINKESSKKLSIKNDSLPIVINKSQTNSAKDLSSQFNSESIKNSELLEKTEDASRLFAVESSEVFATDTSPMKMDFSTLEMSSSAITSPAQNGAPEFRILSPFSEVEKVADQTASPTQKSSKESRIFFSPFPKMEKVADQTTFEIEILKLKSVSKAEKVVIQPTSKIENAAIRSVSKMQAADIKSTCKTERTIQNPSKHPPSLKKQVFQKWDSCQFQDPLTKRTCGEKFQLELEHLQPRWAGGLDHLENRTLLCRTHNQWKYRQQIGLH